MNDYVRREDVRRVLLEADALPQRTGKLLETVPAADVAPVVRGRWKRNERGNYNCSNCKSEHIYVFGLVFCPNCGAEMEGTE